MASSSCDCGTMEKKSGREIKKRRRPMEQLIHLLKIDVRAVKIARFALAQKLKQVPNNLLFSVVE